MKIKKLNDLYFKEYITAEELSKITNRLAKEVRSEIDGDETPLFVCILNGSFIFAADFARAYNGNFEISFVKLASYEGTKSNGMKELIGLNNDVKGRTVVILEDIIDTGNTLQEIYEIFKNKEIKQLKIVTLLFKPDVYRKELHIDNIGKSIEDKFVVGYGLDYNEIGRNLASIYQLTPPPKMKNIVLFGPPGAGKGTQAEVLKTKYDLVHISTGDVFRYNIKNNTELGILAKNFIDKGELVPDEVTINMLKAEVEKNENAKGFIFDGFPRTISQAESLDEYLAESNERIDGMIALEVAEDMLVERILERGLTSGRVDDQNEEKIRNRFNEYYTKTAPVKEYYEKQNNYYGINGVGSIEEITTLISDVFEKL